MEVSHSDFNLDNGVKIPSGRTAMLLSERSRVSKLSKPSNAPGSIISMNVLDMSLNWENYNLLLVYNNYYTIQSCAYILDIIL